MNPIVAALVVIVVLQLVALVVAVVARFWVLRTSTFELHGIDVDRATELVAYYVQGIHDHRFGFPTGIFEVDPARTSPGQVVAREADFKGSAGYGPIKAAMMLPIAGLAMAEGADDAGTGCLVGMLGFTLGAVAALFVIVPCAFVTLVELLLRLLMRGEIRAQITPVPSDAGSVQVSFELRGPSAFGIESQLRRGMRAPHRPDAPPPPDPAGTGGTTGSLDRLGALYAAAASVALICSVVAIVVIGNAEHHTSNAVAAAYPYEEEPYSEPYEEEPYETYEEEQYEAAEEPYEEAEYETEDDIEAPVVTRFDAARGMFRRYWTLIDEGEYAGAYNVYYPTYATQEQVSKPDFVESEREYLPDIGLGQMNISPSSRNPSSPNEMWLYAEVPIQDTVGEFAGECRLFYGDVRMFHADGRWYYRPGEAFGRKPSFGQEGGGIRSLPDDSNRCS
jgi:hypothetical protein